jgi:hypothetical protein
MTARVAPPRVGRPGGTALETGKKVVRMNWPGGQHMPLRGGAVVVVVGRAANRG